MPRMKSFATTTNLALWGVLLFCSAASKALEEPQDSSSYTADEDFSNYYYERNLKTKVTIPVPATLTIVIVVLVIYFCIKCYMKHKEETAAANAATAAVQPAPKVTQPVVAAKVTKAPADNKGSSAAATTTTTAVPDIEAGNKATAAVQPPKKKTPFVSLF